MLAFFVCAMSLADALSLLEQQSPSLAQAQGRVLEASGVARQALAGALPTVQATGSYTRNNLEAVAPLRALLGAPNDLVIQPLEIWNITGSARVPLIAASTWADYAAGLAARDAASANVERVRQTLRFTLRQAAESAWAAEDVLAASERALDNASEHHASAKRAFDAGTATTLAALQAQTEVVRRQSDLAQARADRDRLRLSIGVLLGRAEAVVLERGVVAAKEGNRADVTAAQKQVLSTDRQVKAAWLRHIPTLTASGAVFKQSALFPTGVNEGWRVTVDLTWTLYDGGARYGRLTQAQGARAQAQAQERALTLQTKQEQADGERQLNVAKERLVLAEQQLKLAQEAAANAKRGFAAGVASSLDVREANDKLYQADVAVATSKARAGTAQAALDFAWGRE